MPHTISGALSEVALLAHLQDLQWTELGRLTGCPASRQIDADGRDVYASIYFVDVVAPPGDGLRAFRPDDDLAVASTLGRFGLTMLEADHSLEGKTSGTTTGSAPGRLRVRLSNVLVAMGAGPDDLRISTPSNAHLEAIPAMPTQPESYRLIREAETRGAFFEPPEDRTPWSQRHVVTLPINPDRDLNGVGLLYFANYVAFMDTAERLMLQEVGGFAAAALDGRTTVRRRIGFYGNALATDALRVECDAVGFDASGFLVSHRIRRQSDGRLIAIASAERRLRGPAPSGRTE